MRTIPILLVSAFALCSQTSAPDAPPIQVTGQIAAVDPQWNFANGVGLFMTVRNVSSRGIQGYAYETVFTDPDTGAILEHRTRSAYKQPALGIALAAGAGASPPKPYPIPKLASAKAPAFSFKVDLVVFDDGTTWGPADTRTARQLLSRMH